jgi:signal transduction histidine kinase
MCSFEVPGLLFYTHIPVFLATLLLGFFIYLSNKKNPVNKNLFIFILIFCFWEINDVFQWLTYNVNLNLFFSRISIFGFSSLIFFLYFAYSFVGDKLNLKKKLLLALPFVPVVFLSFTDYNLIINPRNCETTVGPLYLYVAVIDVIYLSFSTFILLRGYRIGVDDSMKSSIRLIIDSIIFLVIWFLGYSLIIEFAITSGLGDSISQFAPFGMVIFIGMLAYAIPKYRLFNIKLLAAQVLVFTLVILVGSELFFAESTTNKILILITLVLSVGFGYMLIHSVKLEVQRKEELQVMSDKLTEANDQLRKLDNAKSEFISIASHQLRTPLTAIKGFVSLLLEGTYGMVDPKVRDALNKVYLSNERMVELVENLLNISRIESGRMEYQYQKWKVEDIIHELYDSFLLVAKNKGLALEINLPEVALPEVEIDGPKAREVISNLMDNALKYTKEGGVKVRAELSKYKDDIDYVRVSVSDTGIGVPKEEVPYLFSKFSRGHDVGRLHVGGTGLGLFVGKSMIEAQHGKLWVESEGEGKGSTFIIELPVSQEKFKRQERMGDFIKEI